MNAGQLKDARQAFNEIVEMAPGFAEGWNKRATIHYLLKDYSASVKDIAQTLRLEPKHFGALSGLGLINAALGRHQAAVKAFEQALIIHPHMRGARQHIKILKEHLKGEET
jgi:tetratricopeptide (TPR) repeat protein